MSALVRLLGSTLITTCLLGGCDVDDVDDDEHGSSVEPLPRSPTELVLTCPPVDAAPLGRVAEGLIGEVQISPCGDVLYAADGAIHLRRVTGEDRAVAPAAADALALAQSDSSFAPTGQFATYRRAVDLVLMDLASGGERLLPRDRIHAFGFAYDEARSRALFYAWELDGLRVIDGEETFIPIDVTAPARLVTARHGAIVAIAETSGRILLVDLVARTTSVVEHGSAADEEPRISAYLSPDGRILVSQLVGSARCGDAICPLARSPVRIHRTDTAAELWQHPDETALLDGGSLAFTGLYLSSLGHAAVLGNVLVTANQAGILLVDTSSYRVSDRPEAFYALSAAGEAIVVAGGAGGTLVRAVDPAGPGQHAGFDANGERTLAGPLVGAPGELPGFIVSPDTEAVASTRWLRAIRNPAGSTIANVLQVGVEVASGTAQSTTTTLAFQPIGIGTCGDLLFGGLFLDGEVPAQAESSDDLPYRPERYYWKPCGDAPGTYLPAAVVDVHAAVELSDATLAVLATTTEAGTGGAAVYTLDRASGAVTPRIAKATALLRGGPTDVLTATALEDGVAVLYHGGI